MHYFFNKTYDLINNFLTKGEERSIKAKKNIIASFVIRGCSIAISLALVPLTINYVNASRYGIWLTISSIVAWISFFDIGLTQGLRNKFAEAKAKGEDYNAQVYVSTTYAVLGIVFFGLWLVLLFINRFLNWSKILDIPGDMQSEVSMLAVIVLTYFCLSFVIKIITTVLIADQQPAKSSLIDLLGQIFSLIFVFILVKTSSGSLVKLGIALCISPLLVLVAANIWLFKEKYKKYRPEFSKVKFSYAKGLFNLGVMFFIIQFANILQFQTANIIIARNFNLDDVTSYNIVYKYFGVLNMILLIFLTPFWSASTEAYLKGDISWIKNGMKRYSQLTVVLILVGILMLIFSNLVYKLWLGENKVNIDFSLSFFGFLFFSTSIFGGKFVCFLNGISALRIQFIASIISSLIYIASALILLKYFKLGVYSLFIASIIANFNTFLLAPLQYHQIIVKEKKGIWIK